MKHERKHDVDYILDEIVGGGGWWQWRITLLGLPFGWGSLYALFISMYAAYSPPHRCFVPSCDLSTSNINESWTSFALPIEHNSNNFLKVADDFDPCHRYESTEATCEATSFNTSSSLTCESYIWDRSQFDETLVTTLGLTCGEDWKRRLLSTIMMVGLMIGSLVGGRLSDRLGRKVAMLVSLVTIVPTTIVGGYIPNYMVYLGLRLVTCTALPIMWISFHTYCLEIFSPQHRKLLFAVKDIPIPFFIFIGIVHFTRNWTSLHLWAGIVAGISLPVWFFIPESPRWMAGIGRRDEAEKVFLDIAKGNGRTLSPEQEKELKNILDTVEAESEADLNPLDMFRKHHLSKTLILLFCWATVCVGFYALTLSATSLSGDIVLNFVYMTLVESPISIYIYFALDSIGRRRNTIIAFALMGTSCIVLALVPKTYTTIVFIAYFGGKLGASLGFVMVYLITAELYPTNLRAQALGICSMFSRIFGMSAEFVTALAVVWQPLPMLILGVPGIVAAILAAFLHETTGRDLPQTMKEAEDIETEDTDTSVDEAPAAQAGV